MHPILILTLLAALSADEPPAAKPAADQAVTLELSTAEKAGPQAKEAKGPKDEKALEVTGDAEASSTTIMVVENPKVTSPQYVLKGRVKYEGVKGNGYLELWNDFGDKGYFFTRGLGAYGPMKNLHGTSDWRDFEMPFYAQEGITLKRLTLNVVLPGPGTVTVSEPLVVEPLPAPKKTEPTEKPADEAKPADGEKAAAADKPKIELTLRTAAEVGSQATSAQGPAGEPAIQVAGGEDSSTSTLVVAKQPGVPWQQYVVRGRVKYEGVKGEGYLELWNYFDGKGEFFSRSLDNSGPMQNLKGTSGWRDFAMPFYADPGMKPDRLDLNVVLPGPGTVTVSEPLIVEPLDTPAADWRTPGEWFTERQGAWIGGIGGPVLGTLGGLIGATAAWGKSRRLTLGLCYLGLVSCMSVLLAGLVALFAAQPEHVYLPLLLVGGIGTGVLGCNLRPIIRRFKSEELRKMTAADVV